MIDSITQPMTLILYQSGLLLQATEIQLKPVHKKNTMYWLTQPKITGVGWLQAKLSLEAQMMSSKNPFLSISQLCYPLCWFHSQGDSPSGVKWPPMSAGLQPYKLASFAFPTKIQNQILTVMAGVTCVAMECDWPNFMVGDTLQ